MCACVHVRMCACVHVHGMCACAHVCMWHVACGMWQVACGKWHVLGMWHVACAYGMCIVGGEAHVDSSSAVSLLDAHKRCEGRPPPARGVKGSGRSVKTKGDGASTVSEERSILPSRGHRAREGRSRSMPSGRAAHRVQGTGYRAYRQEAIGRGRAAPTHMHGHVHVEVCACVCVCVCVCVCECVRERESAQGCCTCTR